MVLYVHVVVLYGLVHVRCVLQVVAHCARACVAPRACVVLLLPEAYTHTHTQTHVSHVEAPDLCLHPVGSLCVLSVCGYCVDAMSMHVCVCVCVCVCVFYTQVRKVLDVVTRVPSAYTAVSETKLRARRAAAAAAASADPAQQDADAQLQGAIYRELFPSSQTNA